MQQISYIPQRERESDVEHHFQANNLTACLDIFERVFLGHEQTLYSALPCLKKSFSDSALTDDIIELADKYGRYGYRMLTGLLNNAGWHVNHKRVKRIWRREGLKVPRKQRYPRSGLHRIRFRDGHAGLQRWLSSCL